MLTIDPMHNLFLSTAKYIMRKVWIENSYLDPNKLSVIEERLSQFCLPSGVIFGRLPGSMDPSTKLTAEQWKNWVIYFSIYCLFDLLPSNHLECWRHFVLACRLMCKPALSQSDITVADALFLNFCKSFVHLYGTNLVTPNMHMHCHLAECVSDYGPLSSFWLFPFERYNGVLEGTPTNKRSIEVQIMQRFLWDINNISLLQCCDDASNCFADNVVTHAQAFQSISTTREANCSHNLVTHRGLEVILEPRHIISVFSESQLSVLKVLYSKFYGDALLRENIELPASFLKMKYISIKGQKFKSGENAYYLANSVIPFSNSIAQRVAGVTDNHLQNSRPVNCLYYAVHRFFPKGSSQPVVTILARVRWPQCHPDRYHIDKPVEVWCANLFEISQYNMFLPVENLQAQVITSESNVKNENVRIIIPVV